MGLGERQQAVVSPYPDGVRVPAKEMKLIEARLERLEALPKYDITIKPMGAESQVKYCALHGEVKFSGPYNRAWDPQALNPMIGGSGGG